MSYQKLPPRSLASERSEGIRVWHARECAYQLRASFRDTALRLGISEAEVTAAHAGTCIRRIDLADPLLQALAVPGEWLVQAGGQQAFIQLRAAIGRPSHEGDSLRWEDEHWSLQLLHCRRCTAFLMRCSARANRSFVLVCDPSGSAVLRLLPIAPLTQLRLQGLWDRPEEVLHQQQHADPSPSATAATLRPARARRLHRRLAQAQRAASAVSLDVSFADTAALRARGPIDRVGSNDRLLHARCGPIVLGLDVDDVSTAVVRVDRPRRGDIELGLAGSRWHFDGLPAGRERGAAPDRCS